MAEATRPRAQINAPVDVPALLRGQAAALAAQASTLRAQAEAIEDGGVAVAPASIPAQLLDKRELSRLLSVSSATVDRLVRSGMPYIPVGDVRRFDLDACRQWLVDQGPRSAPSASPVRLCGRPRPPHPTAVPRAGSACCPVGGAHESHTC